MSEKILTSTFGVFIWKFPNCLQIFQTIWRRKKFRTVQKVSRISKILSRLFGNFTDFWDCMETFQMFAKLLIPSGNFSVYVKKLKTVQKLSVWKLSNLSGNFPDYLNPLQTVRNHSSLPGNFSDCPEIFQCNIQGFAQKILKVQKHRQPAN